MKENKKSLRWKSILAVVAAVGLLIGVGVGAVVLIHSGFRFHPVNDPTVPSQVVQNPTDTPTVPTEEPTEPPTELPLPIGQLTWRGARDLVFSAAECSFDTLYGFEISPKTLVIDDMPVIVYEVYCTLESKTLAYEVNAKSGEVTLIKTYKNTNKLLDFEETGTISAIDAFKAAIQYDDVSASDVVDYDYTLTHYWNGDRVYNIRYTTETTVRRYHVDAFNGTVSEYLAYESSNWIVSYTFDEMIGYLIANYGHSLEECLDMKFQLVEQDGKAMYRMSYTNGKYIYENEFHYYPFSVQRRAIQRLDEYDSANDGDTFYMTAEEEQEVRKALGDFYEHGGGSFKHDIFYFGEYNGAHVFFPHVPAGNAVTYDHVAGLIFEYSDTNQLLVCYESKIYGLEQAYEQGIMDFDDFYDLHASYQPKLLRRDEQQIIEDYQKQYPQYSDKEIEVGYLFEYNNAKLIVIKGDQEHTAYNKFEYIGPCKYYYTTTQRQLVYKDGKFYSLQEAYDLGILNQFALEKLECRYRYLYSSEYKDEESK